MKKTISTILLSLTLFSNFSLANSAATKYVGYSKIQLTYFTEIIDKEWCESGIMASVILNVFSLGSVAVNCVLNPTKHTGTIETALQASLNEVGDGKAMLQLKSQSAEGCAGFSGNLYAEANEFGVYNLYLSEQDHNDGKVSGQATKVNDTLEIVFKQESMTIGSAGVLGKTCLWELGKGFNIQLNATP